MRFRIACVRAACVVFSIVAILLCGAARAQGTRFDVTGKVTANDGTPIAGASVVLASQGVTKNVRSDAHGVFIVRNVSAGTYSLRAAARGYEIPSERTVTIGPSSTTLTIVLSPATTNSLTVIGQVRASAGETVSTSSAPTVSLSAQDAAASGVTAASSMVWKQLSTTPVLPMGGGSNAAVVFAVRGPDPTETLVDIDGHQVNNGNTGTFDLSLLDPAALQDVQIVYGIAPSSLIGPNTIGGGINIITLQPTSAPHSLMRIFGGSYGSFGETLQTTGTANRLGYAVSLHNTTSLGSVNQTIPVGGTLQSVGSDSNGNSILTKLRYQFGDPNGYGYVQLNFRDQTVTKNESALLTTFTPAGFSGGGGGGGGDALRPEDSLSSAVSTGSYQSFNGTLVGAHQANYGLDAQVPLGSQTIDGAPATLVKFSHLTTLASQSVSGPGTDTLPYLYNQRDLLGDDWLELDHRFGNGLLSFKYDLGTETLSTDYVQGQAGAEVRPVGPAVATSSVQRVSLSQTQRSAVLRYTADPTSQIHYSLALYQSDFSSFGSSLDPRAGIVWTPTGDTAVRASIGTTFQAPQLSELIVPPPNERVPVGGIVFIGNPNLRADHATDFDLGGEQILGNRGTPLHLSLDLYQTNLRAPSNQLVVTPIPSCQTERNPTLCPLSYPVNAGNGVYRGIEVRADQQLGRDLHLRAGWDVNSSFLTVIPASIQNGAFVTGQQTLGEPLHKAYLELDREAPAGLTFGARLNYEGFYNELNRSPYATLDAHVAYQRAGYEYGIYGTNLTNVYSNPFTITGGGVPYGALPGQLVITPNAFVLQGAAVNFVVTRTI
jgi:outer membrane receptor protein involved in Fe transport